MYLEERLARSPVYLCTAAVYFLITDPKKKRLLVQLIYDNYKIYKNFTIIYSYAFLYNKFKSI